MMRGNLMKETFKCEECVNCCVVILAEDGEEPKYCILDGDYVVWEKKGFWE